MPIDHECPRVGVYCPICNPSPAVQEWAMKLFDKAYGKINDCDFGSADYEFVKSCSHDMIADLCCDSGVPRELVQQVAQCINSQIN